MTEREQTEKAMLMAKEKRATKDAELQKPPKPQQKTSAIRTKPKPKLPKNAIELEIQDSVKVTLLPWTGKTKKRIRKLFQGVLDPQDIDLREVINILVYKHIKEDILLTDAEQQYLIGELKKISISPKIAVISECPECQSENKIITGIDSCVTYTPPTLPKNFKEYKFKNVKRSEAQNNVEMFYEETDDSLTSKEDIEYASRIQFPSGVGIVQAIETLDSMPLSEFEEMTDELNDSLGDLVIQKTQKCKVCRAEVIFPIDIMKEIFEKMLK